MYAYVILSQSLQENLKLLIIHQICQIIHQLHFFFFLEVFLLGRNGLGGLVSTSQELKKKKGDKWRSRSYQRNYGFDDLQAILLQVVLVALWTSCPAGVLGLLFTLTILSTSQVSWLQVKSQLSLINQGRS